MQSRALVTIGTGEYVDLLASSGETFRRYALRHGYEYVQGSGAMAEPRPPAWAKIPLIQRLLEGHDVVVWIDADAIILDHSRDIASELNDGAWQALVAHRSGGDLIPNTGVWVLRRAGRTHDFLEAVWNSVNFIDHDWWENAAVMDLLGFTLESPVHLANPAAPWLEGTQWLPEEWNRLTFYSGRLEAARIRHLAAESRALQSRQLRADLGSLDGQRIRPALARLEWSLKAAGLDEERIRSELGQLVQALNERTSQHPLWYPYVLYRSLKHLCRGQGGRSADAAGGTGRQGELSAAPRRTNAVRAAPKPPIPLDEAPSV